MISPKGRVDDTLYLFFIVIYLTSCTSTDKTQTHSFQMFEEDGVTVAVTSAVPKYVEPLFRYEEVLRLQQDEDRPESLLYRTTDFLMGDDGYFYVMDRGNDRIAVFDTEGMYVRSVGRGGDGPGEFRTPRILWIRDGIIAVSDNQLQRTSLFNTDGLFLRSYSHHWGSSPRITIYPTNDDRLVLLSSVYKLTPNGELLRWYEVVVVDAEGDTLARLSSPQYVQSRQFVIEQYLIGGAGQVYFGPQSMIQYHEGMGLLRYHTSEPVLEWYNLNGQLLRKICIEMEREPVTEEERKGIERGFQQSINDAENEQMKALYKGMRKHSVIPEWKSYWRSTVVDDSGHYWLRYHYDYTVEDADTYLPQYRVLSPDGEYLGDTQYPVRFGTVSNGHFLASLENEETGEEVFVVYRIIPALDGLEYP